MKDYFVLANKNIKRKGIRSWLTLIGIFIGIVAVVSLVTLSNGLEVAISSQFGVSSTEIITVRAGGLSYAGAPGAGVTNPLVVDDVYAIDKLSSVESAIRRNLPSGKFEFNDKAIFGITMSLPSGSCRKLSYEILDLEIEKGRLLKDGDTNKVLLGFNFYANSVGFDKKIVTGNKIIIQNKSFEVIGIIKKRGSFVFDNIVYVNNNVLENLMGYGDTVDAIAVKVKNKGLMDRAKEDIEKLLRKRRNVKKGEDDFEVSTPDASLKMVNDILGGVQIFIFIIASISILVGAIGIVNTMTTSVLERRKEIGIMKAIGAKNKDIFLMFFAESGVIGLIGGVAGLLAGLVLGFFGVLGINNFVGSDVVFSFNIPLIIFSIVGSFVIGAVAGIVPALNAAKQNPVEALMG